MNSLNIAISNINKALDILRTEMQEIKLQLNRDDEWKTKFQTGLTDLQQLVIRIGEKLDEEVDTRKMENIELKKEHIGLKESVIPLSKTQKRLQLFKGSIITIISGVLVYVITRLIQFFS